jgi:indole-3-glycerol phosphate synthase
MDNILKQIKAAKQKQVKQNKDFYPIALLENSEFFNTRPVSLKSYILRDDKSGIIAEFKRKSPSKGIINSIAKVSSVSVEYMQAGASALSILTDNQFFGGDNIDLQTARKMNYSPILRKEFIIDEYQIYESKSIGSDAILLIASVLTKKEIHRYATIAKLLGMQTILEIHNKDELRKISHIVDIIGVNNRNLNNFNTNLITSFELVSQIPVDFIKISESGIETTQDIINLRNAGYDGFLIGDLFMRQSNPGKSCFEFINSLNRLKHAG